MTMYTGAERVHQDIIRLCHAGLDATTLRVKLLRRLRAIVPFDVAFFATADPGTVLFTSAVVDDVLARATPRFLQNEFLQEDAHKFRHLARSRSPVGGLAAATRGELERSLRYREILEPLALGDELRAALRVDGACWGVLCLHRERSSPPFTPAEAASLARVAPHMAEGLRAALLVGGAVTMPVPDGPGVLVLDDDLAVAALTPPAERWLAEIMESDGPCVGALPGAVTAVAMRLRELERGVPGARDPLPRVRLRTASGRWLVLHASRLAGAGQAGQIAIIVEEAQPEDVAPVIVQAYGLTPREREIAQLVLRGLSTAEISGALHISTNTVQDHCKAIFDKVGVSSRRELVAQIFGRHYLPRITVAAQPGALMGGFSPSAAPREG
jgi:DNA-binding CsgD family transcriptional regulator